MIHKATIKEYLDLTKQGLSTSYNIGQMAQYRYRFVLGKELQNDSTIQVDISELTQDRDKIIKHACFAGLGIAGLLAIGITGLISREYVGE